MRWLFATFLMMTGCAPEKGAVETWTLVAELGEASDFPTLEEIRPYRDALIAHQYLFLGWRKKNEDPMPEFGKFAVYHWAIVDGRPTEVAELKTGDVLEMKIQRMIDRTDLKGRFRKNSLDAFDLQEFFAVEASPLRSDND